MAKATKSRKVSISLKDVRKYVFWVVVPILVLTAFFFTNKAKTSIKEKYDAKKTQVEGEKSAIDKIVSNAKHPNDATIKAIAEEKEVLSKNVYDAWMLMYQDQKARNRWPRQLSEEFLDIVRNAKFRDPIGVGKPYILEDYAYFMVNNLPELIKNLNRRRVQVREYQLIENREQPEKNRFEPIYVCSAKEVKDGLPEKPEGEFLEQLNQMDRMGEDFLYAVTDKNVYLYNLREDYISEVEESYLRDYLRGIKEKVPFYREMDPMIANPRNFVPSGGISGEMSGPGRSSGPGGKYGGMAGSPGGEIGRVANVANSSGAIPGDNIDPASEQVAKGNAAGMGQGMRTAGNASNELYPGLPPYLERRRIVGNIDWLSPDTEIFNLLNWGQGQVPLSIEIWYLQEDLWVYESLIRVLVETNKEAVDNISQAPVKCIEQMLIGRNASLAWNTLNTLSLFRGDSEGGRGGFGGDSEMSEGRMSGPMGDRGMGGASSLGSLDDDESEFASGPGGMGPNKGIGGADTQGVGEEAVLNRILNYRYLGAEDQPLTAETPAPFAEFNRMPICLKLVVDQRRIQDVLVNCANCSMPIDIRHVRVNPDNAGSSPMGGSSGGGRMSSGRMSSGPMGGGPASSGPMGGESGNVSMIGRSELSQTGGYGADAIRIEIYGIINIFNEPDPEIFGTGVTEEEAAEDGEAEVSDASEEGVPEETVPVPAEGEATETAAPTEETTPAEETAGEEPAAP